MTTQGVDFVDARAASQKCGGERLHIFKRYGRRGHQGRAATQFLCQPDLEAFNVKPRTHHRRKVVDILFSDGHTVSRPNKNGRFNVDATDYNELRNSFSKILKVFEQADAEP